MLNVMNKVTLIKKENTINRGSMRKMSMVRVRVKKRKAKNAKNLRKRKANKVMNKENSRNSNKNDPNKQFQFSLWF